MLKRYSELKNLKTFEERYEYLKVLGTVGEDTFGFDRYLNQMLYKSHEWKQARRAVIIRDMGFDLGIDDREIQGKVLVHHMNPITKEDIVNRNPIVFDPEYLITVSHMTHEAIHYGDSNLLIPSKPEERTPNDTCPWKL